MSFRQTGHPGREGLGGEKMKNKLIFRYVFILDVLVTNQEQLAQYFNIVQPDLLFIIIIMVRTLNMRAILLTLFKCIIQYC